MTDPVLRAITPETTYDDPSEDLLFMLVEEIEQGTTEFLIVERLSDPSSQTYAQTIRESDGSYAVEKREGGPDRHFRVLVPDFRTAHELLTAWAFETGADDVAWERLQF